MVDIPLFLQVFKKHPNGICLDRISEPPSTVAAAETRPLSPCMVMAGRTPRSWGGGGSFPHVKNGHVSNVSKRGGVQTGRRLKVLEIQKQDFPSVSNL